jgi:hypothetical protein
MNIAARLVVLRANVMTSRDARRRRQQLQRELAEYATPAERMEIEAVIARYPAEQTQEIQAILTAQARSRPIRHCAGLPGRAW